MRIRPSIYKFLAVMIVVFAYLICSWTVFTTTKTITIPGEGVYTGQVKNGYFNGTGTWESEIGVVYSGNFKNGLYDGQGKMTFADGTTYVGAFKDGYMHGQGVMTFPDGHTHKGEWNADVFNENHEDCDHQH